LFIIFYSENLHNYNKYWIDIRSFWLLIVAIGWNSHRMHECSANSWTIAIKSNTDIATLAPPWTPWVSHDKEFLFVFNAPSYCYYCMIQTSTTFISVKYSTFVMLKVIAAGMDMNGYWLFLKSCFDIFDWFWFDIIETLNTNFSCILWVFALFIPIGSVWVIFFKLNWVWVSILECPIFQTTIATMTLGIAIYKLLFR